MGIGTLNEVINLTRGRWRFRVLIWSLLQTAGE